MKPLITATALFLAIGGCASPEPGRVVPDVTKAFQGDHREMARCIHDAIAAVNPTLPRAEPQGPDTVVVTLAVAQGTAPAAEPLPVTRYTVRKAGANRIVVDYQVLKKTAFGSGTPGDVGWRMVEKCGRGERIALGRPVRPVPRF